MLDLTNETGLSLTEATKQLPSLGGRRLDVSTLWRWCRKGVRGVRLEYVRLGHRIITSREALARFAQRLAEADRDADASSLVEGQHLRKSSRQSDGTSKAVPTR